MSSEPLDTTSAHPLARLLEDIDAALDRFADAPAWTMTPTELGATLPGYAVAKNRLEAVELRMLREADRHAIGDAVGAADTAAWWAHTTRTTKPSAHQLVALASRLDDDVHQAASAASAAGAVNRAQAAVIVECVDALPADLVDPWTRRSAERRLVELATEHGPKELRLLGRRILEVIAPELAEERERRLLEDEEHHAAATATFTMHSDGQGSVVGRFKIPALAGAMLAKHLNAIAAPRHRFATGDPAAEHEKVARPLRLGAAFTEYVETRPAGATPKAGGLAATVVVTMTMADLLGGEKAATLDTGERISASEARRLACGSGMIPAVLGGPSEVLDLGRKRRFHSGPQRIVMGLRDGGCAERHCDWPPGMCHGHHGRAWSRGGRTSVKDGLLLCPRHHSLAHDSRYETHIDESRRVTFTRRT
ncbi:MAG: DUF222 domain-containing protein [Marmoricola sp.]